MAPSQGRPAKLTDRNGSALPVRRHQMQPWGGSLRCQATGVRSRTGQRQVSKFSGLWRRLTVTDRSRSPPTLVHQVRTTAPSLKRPLPGELLFSSGRNSSALGGADRPQRRRSATLRLSVSLKTGAAPESAIGESFAKGPTAARVLRPRCRSSAPSAFPRD